MKKIGHGPQFLDHKLILYCLFFGVLKPPALAFLLNYAGK
jgi:hypothetical protein